MTKKDKPLPDVLPWEKRPKSLHRRRTWAIFALACLLIGLIVYANVNPPNPAAVNPTTCFPPSCDRGKIETNNYRNNANDTKLNSLVTTACYRSAVISVVGLTVRVTGNFVESPIFNATTNSQGCASWAGVAGVSYDVMVYYSLPDRGNLTTSIGLLAGETNTIGLG